MSSDYADYADLLGELRLPAWVVDCARGRLRLPVADVVHPVPWYGQRPAFLPLWSQGFVLVGIWKHWFTERPLSFVKVYLRAEHRLVEIARTPEQFSRYAVISAIVAHDGIRKETVQFAEECGVSDLDELDAVTLSSGDDPKGYMSLPAFQEQTPLASIEDSSVYDGWFPSANFSSVNRWWRHCCSVEVDSEARRAWPAHIAVPAWLDEEPTRDMFSGFLDARDHESAWLTLNSAAWALPAMRRAIEELSAAAQDPLFSRLSSAWLGVSTPA